MQFFKKIVEMSNGYLIKISMLVLLFMMFLVVGNVLSRFFFRNPIPGTFELTRISLAIVVFTSLGYGQLKKVYIQITFFFSRFPVLVQKVLQVFNYLLTLVLFSLVFWQMLKYAERMSAAGEFTSVLRLPVHPWIIIAAVGVFFFGLTLLWDLIQTILKIAKGEVLDES